MRKPVLPGDVFMDINDLAEYSRINKKKLRELVKKMPHYRAGRKLLVKKADFDAYMREFLRDPHPLVEEIIQELRVS